MGANFAQTALPLLKGGLSGASQGLQQYGNPNPQFRFGQMPNVRKPALGQGITPNAASPFSANPYWGGDPNVNGGNYT